MAHEERYFEELKRRAKDSRVYRKYQLFGLEIARLLGDEDHKSLYMKLAKIHYPETLMNLAKTISENKNVKNKGAYFMSCLKGSKAKNRHERKDTHGTE